MTAPYIPTPEARNQVQAMAGFGIDQIKISRILGIALGTLKKYYRDELDLGADKANSLVADSLFKKATSSSMTSASVTAAIFWLKTRARWKETHVQENVGKDGGAIQVENVNARDVLSGRIASLIADSGEDQSSQKPH